MTAPILADGLSKSFGSSKAVDGLKLAVEPGEIYGLVGSDGAGKTTTIRLLVGALRPDAGTVTICGHSVASQGEKARAHIGYLSQRFSLYEDLTVLENIRFFAELRGLKRTEWLPRCLEILEFVGLVEYQSRRAGQLSGGMRQKLGLATALVTQPEILLLDEPTTGVDPVTRQDFWQLILRLVALDKVPGDGHGTDRRSVLMTTPYMDEASRCHRIGFMRAGKIIAEGTPAKLRSILSERIVEVRGAVQPGVRASIQALEGIEDVRLFGDRYHLRLASRVLPSMITALETIPSVSRIEAHAIPATLEDVFIFLSGTDGSSSEGAHA